MDDYVLTATIRITEQKEQAFVDLKVAVDSRVRNSKATARTLNWKTPSYRCKNVKDALKFAPEAFRVAIADLTKNK